MTFLKKLGQLLAKAVVIATGIGPLITPLLGSAKAGSVESTVVSDLTSIGSVVIQAEALMQTASGPDRLQAATPLIAHIIQTSELVAGKKIHNEPLFIQGCSKITSGTADILNSLDEEAVKTA